VITQQTFDQRTRAKQVAEAAVATQEAVVRQAALDLEFTELRAPVSGRIGDRRISIGNLVTGGTSGNTTLLATIESIDPIRFEFTLDEASYLRYGQLLKDATDGAHRGLMVPVRLKLIDEPAFSHEGNIDFVDNAIDRSTSTIRARAVFANPHGGFTPRMFGRVQLAAAGPRPALLVPEAATSAPSRCASLFWLWTRRTSQPRSTSRSGRPSMACGSSPRVSTPTTTSSSTG
jgi:RND family efflux transporter MFP subunit